MRLRKSDFDYLYEGLDFGEPTPGWNLTLYPDAREASGRFTASIDFKEGRQGTPGEGADPKRCALVAAGRARSAVRRYCTSNRMNRLATLTYAGKGCHDPLVLRADLADFFKKLRSGLGGKPFPYLWVPEWHPGGHGLHAHFACGQFIRRSLIEESWGRGFIHIKLIGGLPHASTAIDEARHNARYLAKYMEKEIDTIRAMGLHRYDCAQGFAPRKLKLPGPTLDEAVGLACLIMGAQRHMVMSTSDQWRDWVGPRAVALQWES